MRTLGFEKMATSGRGASGGAGEWLTWLFVLTVLNGNWQLIVTQRTRSEKEK